MSEFMILISGRHLQGGVPDKLEGWEQQEAQCPGTRQEREAGAAGCQLAAWCAGRGGV